MKLLIVRHAKAFERDEWAKEKKSDELRPLIQEGIDEFVQVSKGLKTLLGSVDLVFSSPLTRARQTADILVKEFKDAKLSTTDILKQGTPWKEVQNFLTKLEWGKDQMIAMVGHENHLSTILASLIGCAEEGAVRFKKGGVACVDLGISEGKVSGKLLWFLPPKVFVKLVS